MQELRFVAVSEDGSYAVLAIPGRSGRFMLPIDDRLRAVAKGQFSRLAQYEIEVENPLRPKEIQTRIRAGETVEEIADAAGIPVERVRWFEGPVLAERAYMAQQSQNATVRRPGDSTSGPRLGETVAERLTELGADPEDAQWDSRKHGDGSWQIQLAFRAGGRLHIAEWLFDPRRRHVAPADDNAARLSLPDTELPPPAGGSLGAATVTPIRPRPDRQPLPSQRPAPGSGPVPDDEPVEEPDDMPARVAAQAASRGGPAAPVPPRAPMRTPPAGEPPAMPAPSDLPAVNRPAASDPAPAAAQEPEGEPAPSPTHQPKPPVPAAAEQSPAEAPARGRGKKSSQRGRRSSVPSWDEIMLGNSRQPD
ncbi:MAG TPA: septation protein SepH [Streptosporangiaceae bacterium]